MRLVDEGMFGLIAYALGNILFLLKDVELEDDGEIPWQVREALEKYTLAPSQVGGKNIC